MRWSKDLNCGQKKNRPEKGDSACQKSLFDKLVDGEASSPATATPSRFCLSLSDSGRKICKVAIFSPGNGISLR